MLIYIIFADQNAPELKAAKERSTFFGAEGITNCFLSRILVEN
jgi:hypothetical protein